MMFSSFRSLPKEMEEAALTDGCTAARRVPAGGAAPGEARHGGGALLCIMFSWNDFLTSAFLNPAESKPISVALLPPSHQGHHLGHARALGAFSTIPIVLIALLLNRYFVQGLTRGVN